jgi:hypothetical protein
MGVNTGNGARIGVVRNRKQTFNPRTKKFVKLDTESGKILACKNEPFKSIRMDAKAKAAATALESGVPPKAPKAKASKAAVKPKKTGSNTKTNSKTGSKPKAKKAAKPKTAAKKAAAPKPKTAAKKSAAKTKATKGKAVLKAKTTKVASN